MSMAFFESLISNLVRLDNQLVINGRNPYLGVKDEGRRNDKNPLINTKTRFRPSAERRRD